MLRGRRLFGPNQGASGQMPVMVEAGLRRLAAAVIACATAFLVVSAFGCTAGPDGDTDGSATPISTLVSTGGGSLPLEGVESLKAMATAHDRVVIATVVGYEDASRSQEFGLKFIDGYRAPAAAPAPTSPTDQSPPSLSLFEVAIQQSASAPGNDVPEAGEHLLLHSTGGYRNGAAFESDEDPLLQVGETYLLFIGGMKPPSDGIGPALSSALVYGKVKMDGDGRLRSIWKSDTPLPYLSEIEGRLAIEVFEDIRQLYSKR